MNIGLVVNPLVFKLALGDTNDHFKAQAQHDAFRMLSRVVKAISLDAIPLTPRDRRISATSLQDVSHSSSLVPKCYVFLRLFSCFSRASPLYRSVE